AIDYLNINAYLEDLKVINSETEVAYPFTFNPDTFEYTVKIDKLSTDVLITGRAQDQYNAAIIGLGRYYIDTNGATAQINVVASDNKTILTYTLNIIREEQPSSNTRLKTLSISGQNLTFNPDTQTYIISVDNGINALDISAIPESAGATVRIIGADDISEGRNVIMLEVEAEDGQIGYYQLMVNKDSTPNNFLTMLLIISLLIWIITILIILIRASRDKGYFKKKMIK
ncbi:MAG: cadherin-like beta sandwich domain-containing protein, partial [Candidatus Izemoplasmatales bacterium]